jgi:hypothetical protein
MLDSWIVKGFSKGGTRTGVWVQALVVLVAALALAAGERLLNRVVAKAALPTHEAQWIWAPEVSAELRPVSFHLARDFHLDFSVETAELICIADEEYVVTLNGIQVGGGRFAPDRPADSYEVRDLLRWGRNRLLVEARSSRGAGAVLAALTAAGGLRRLRVVSDGDWRVYRQHRKELFDLDAELPGAESPVVWALPPAGRWPLPRAAEPRPTIPSLGIGSEPLNAARAKVGDETADWQLLSPDDRFEVPLGRQVAFDWGRQMTGYLVLRYPAAGEPLALVWVGEDLPRPGSSSAVTFLAGMQGSRIWSDAIPRRFRYVVVSSSSGISGAQVLPVAPDAMSLFPEDAPKRGVFGLEPTGSGTPLQNEIWRELHGFAGVGSREHR